MRILHTGDTHIGYRQYGSDERRRDFLEAFERVVRDAIDDDVDVLVHAGDLFHSRNPRLEDVIPTIDLFRELRDAGIAVLAVVGNHERKRQDQWLDLLEGIDAVTRLGREPVVIDGAAFYGVDYVPPSRIDGFDYGAFAPASDADHAFLALHGRFEPFPYGEWPLERFVTETTVDWDRFLLGDYHHHEREDVAGVVAEYCGSTERVSTEERAARGYSVIEVDDDGVSASRRSIPTRDFVFVEVDVAPETGDATDDVVDRTEEYEVEEAVVIVEVEGAPEPTVIQSEVEGAVRDRGATVVRVNDRRDAPGRDEDAIEVSFVDPDEAVRERIDDVRLSDAGRRVDELVRGDRVPDSNVADEVEDAISDLVEDADDGVFERPDAPDEAEAVGDTAPETEATAGEREADGEAETADAADGEPEAPAGMDEETEGHGGGAAEEDVTEEGATEDEQAAGAATETAREDGDAEGEAEPAVSDEADMDDVDDGEEEEDGESDEAQQDAPEVAGQSSMGDWT